MTDSGETIFELGRVHDEVRDAWRHALAHGHEFFGISGPLGYDDFVTLVSNPLGALTIVQASAEGAGLALLDTCKEAGLKQGFRIDPAGGFETTEDAQDFAVTLLIAATTPGGMSATRDLISDYSAAHGAEWDNGNEISHVLVSILATAHQLIYGAPAGPGA